MALHYVFDTQAAAQAAVDAIDGRARDLYARFGYTVDASGAVVGKRASDRADMPDAQRTITFAAPVMGGDGKWRVPHVEQAPSADVVIDETTGQRVQDYVGQDLGDAVVEG